MGARVTDQEVHAANIRAAERAHDRADEQAQQVNEAAVRDAQAAIRIVLILNGGAVIAVLAFVGSLAAKGTSQLPLLHEVISHSFWFVLGAASTGVVAALAYLTNVCYGASWAYLERAWAHPYLRNTRKATWWGRAGLVFHILGLLGFLAGLGFFITGVSELRGAMLRLFA